MRAASRSRVLVLVSALAVSCLAGVGCEAPLPGSGLAAARTPPTRVADRPTAPWWEVPAEAPRRSEPAKELPTIEAPRPLADATGPATVVWRASPLSLSDAPESNAPVVRTGLRERVLPHRGPAPRQDELPKELSKVTMPPYRIEPPDILLIDAFRVIPRPAYKIEPLDELVIQAPPAQVIPNEPISGVYPVGPDGQVDLGFSYGKVAVAGLTPEQARPVISKHVADVHGIKPPAVSVALGRTRGFQQVHGEHLVRMDGMVNLGVYGEVYVAGMTLSEAKAAVEAQLARTLLNPEVTVDVLAYNSKVYYVIYDGGGFGQQIYKLPVVGGETVLDALSELRGLPAPSSTRRIWVARPVPGQVGCRQVLPVDWAAITEGAATNTNYQLFPGDRIYVKADCWVALENGVSKVVAPFERIFGFTLLGNATIRAVAGQNNGNNNGF